MKTQHRATADRRWATKPPWALGVVVSFCLCAPAAAESPRTVDLRFAAPGILTLRMQVKGAPRYVGDIDGDGRDDFLIREKETVSDPFGSFVLVYGAQAADLEGKVLDLAAVRHTRFVGSEDLMVMGSDDAYAGVGDINGDGYGDLLLGSSYASWNDVKWSGLVLLVWGGPELGDSLSVDDLAVSQERAVRFTSHTEKLHFGDVVVSAGDLDGDGWPDVAISASSNGTEDGGSGAGKVYILFGGPDLASGLEAEDIAVGVRGSVLYGAHGGNPGHPDYLGSSAGKVAAVGDINGDGLDDLAVTAEEAHEGRGAVYIVLGSPDLPPALLAATPGGPLVEIVGGASGRLGSSVAGAGDVDGDGYADLLIGHAMIARSYLVFGAPELPASSQIPGGSLRYTRFKAPAPPRWIHVSQAGGPSMGIVVPDQDGDGFDEILLNGASMLVRLGTHCGKAFLISGGPDLPADVDVSQLGTATLPGTTYLGSGPHAFFGGYPEASGDFDGDGTNDIVVTSRFRSGLPSPYPMADSHLYVIFGGRGDGKTFSVQGLVGDSGGVDGGYEVRVIGTGFAGEERVWFGQEEAPETEVLSTAEIRVVVPPGRDVGAVAVRVESAAGSATLERAFLYIARLSIPDVVLDPEWLRAHGYRSMVYADTLWPPGGAQCMNCFFGDLDGDGCDDLAIGAPVGTPDGWSRVAVIFGKRSSFPEEIGLGESGAYCTLIDGGASTGNLGSYIAFPGDLDGDGFRDLAMGRCVVFGRQEWPETILLEQELETGEALALPSRLGGRPIVAAPGDLIEEGIPSLLLSFDLGLGGGGAEGIVTIYREGLSPSGVAEPRYSEIFGDPDLVVIPNTVEIGGSRPRAFGSELSAAGDVNGDGHLDFVVGADHGLCAYYLVLGGRFDFLRAGIKELLEVGRAVLLHYNEQWGGYCGRSGTACALGDFNGDGLDDVALGAPGGGLDFHGVVHVLLGSEDLGSQVREVSLVTAGPDQVLRIVGEISYDWLGYPEALGDVNGDGYPDLGITGEYHRAEDRAYVVYGGPDVPGDIELGSVGRLGLGYRILAKEDHWFSGANGGIAGGDLDADGIADIAIGEAVPAGEERKRQAVVIFGGRQKPGEFLRGDSNSDGELDITDAVYLLEHLFRGGEAPPCLDAADTDDTGELDITDAIFLLQHLFLGGPPPPPPYPEKGVDPTPDELTCGG